MPDQSELPDRSLSSFGLIETLLWTSGEGFWLLEEHRRRLVASAAALGFRYDESQVLSALQAAAASLPAPRLRVRLVLQPNGEIETSAMAIEPPRPDVVWRVVPARRRFASDDPLLRHKTTRRELYESELAASRADEVLFVNERSEICEGARANVFLPGDSSLLTPPLSCGLLPGTLRARLLATGQAKEHILRVKDFEDVEFFVGNSVRGLVRARLENHSVR
jgi:4-amino-4-deoxychorismate lyase